MLPPLDISLRRQVLLTRRCGKSHLEDVGPWIRVTHWGETRCNGCIKKPMKAVNSARVLGKTLVELSIPQNKKNMTLGWGDHRYIRYDGDRDHFFGACLKPPAIIHSDPHGPHMTQHREILLEPCGALLGPFGEEAPCWTLFSVCAMVNNWYMGYSPPLIIGIPHVGYNNCLLMVVCPITWYDHYHPKYIVKLF